jgi:hypothetical protein
LVPTAAAASSVASYADGPAPYPYQPPSFEPKLPTASALKVQPPLRSPKAHARGLPGAHDRQHMVKFSKPSYLFAYLRTNSCRLVSEFPLGPPIGKRFTAAAAAS